MLDNLLLNLIGKPVLNQPALITVVAENFSLIEDQARFLRATLAIPEVKQLPFKEDQKRLIQIGPLHQEVREQLERAKWAINQYDNLGDQNICDQVERDLKSAPDRCLIYINDVSRLELISADCHQLPRLVHRLKVSAGHFVVLLYQSSPRGGSKLLRNLEYISDASARVKSCKAGYFNSIWTQTIPAIKTLVPARIDTSYDTCKIGKFYWSADLLCFYEKRKVAKNHDLNKDTYLEERAEDDAEGDEISQMLSQNDLEDGESGDSSSTLQPYTRAQDPEKSRIFYYPDKEDDIDESDPDNDLGF